MKPKILIFSGSIRSGSTNQRLAGAALKIFTQMECQPCMISLADYPLPIYDGDLEREEGVPENAKKLARMFGDHHGIMIASPEYNGSVTPLLKNTIDWISRVSKDENGPIVPYKGKFGAVIATSPGQMGGVNSAAHLRAVLSRLGMLVISETVNMGNSGTAFDDMDDLKDERAHSFLQTACSSLVEKSAIFNLR